MDSTSTSRFRFRDHNQELYDDDESSEGDTSVDSSSISSNEDEEPELQSMTAKGVQYLCSELLELKQESDEDFQRDIFSNYSAFIAIVKEVEGLQNEMLGLKKQASLQMRLVKNVTDGFSLRVLTEETIESMTEEPLHMQPSSPNSLDTHIANVSEILDTLFLEYRLDDALALLEMEGDFFQNLNLGEKISSDQLMSYNSTISQKRAMLSDHFILVSKNPRVSAPELQKALFGLCQLGESHLATELLLQYYHTRIETGTRDLHLLDVLYIQGVAKYVFSMISQAVRSFAALNSENYSYPLELIQWGREEIAVFAVCFTKYIATISEISGRLSTTIDAIQIAISYCALLETQGIFLRESLIKSVRPCIEEVSRNHIDHLSNVIGIFTSMDTWVLGKYFVSGILNGRNYGVVDQEPEYYFLTNSGRKFVTLFQSVAEDTSPLIAMQMESSVLKGLMDLLTSYIVILESALSGNTDVIENGISRINLPDSPTQGAFILINLSTLIQFFSCIIRNTFDGIHHLDFEIDNYIVFVQDVYSRLKSNFLEQFICNIFSPNAGHEYVPESYITLQEDSKIYDQVPSVPYMELYLELKKLQKLSMEDCIDMNWLMNFFKDVLDTAFGWISSKSEIWTIGAEILVDDRPKFEQLVLDIQFLVEMARSGGYLTDDMINSSSDIVSRLEESFVSAGLHPLRDLNNDEWPANAASRALEKLRELHAKESLQNENSSGTKVEESNQMSDQHAAVDLLFEDDDAVKSRESSRTDTNTDLSRTRDVLIQVDPEDQNSLSSRDFETEKTKIHIQKDESF